ncbi:hypothetical protein PIB30_081300 [Stylosanthes scabra]|uniref:Uncharacterized protein n=1 Tax=Stylosanthes scabra TaxID=79078 RepID=A0ABU6RRV7_9FABA|nr:hypothetical protein [Stylosanthes scabra]
MSEPPLLSLHYDSEITTDHNGSVVFCSNQPLFIRMPRYVRSLAASKNFVAQVIEVQDTKRVMKIYYRYPMEADGNFQFKSNKGFNYGVDSEPLQGMLPKEFESHEGSAAGDPMTEPFHLDPDQDDGGDEVEEELNSFRISQVSLAQPSISQPYEYPDHFFTLNLDAMNSDVYWGQGALTMIRRLNLRLVNNLRTRRKFSWQLRHIA